MALTQGIQQKQSQTLSMTPELQQSLKMLQLSSQDLAEFLMSELEKNPLLVEDEGESYVQAPQEQDSSQSDLTEIAENRDLNSNNDSLDYDFSQTWQNGEITSGGKGGYIDGDMEFDRTLEGEVDFRQKLIQDFFLDVEETSKRILGVYMIDFLDDAGYFIGDIHDIATNFGCDYQDVEDILHSLQRLEPAGIFARSLSECLCLQLEDKGRLDPCIFTLISNLELLGMNKYDILMDLCDVNFEELEEMIAEVKGLNPKPAAGYMIKEMTPTQPDVFITKRNDDGFGIEVNSAALPKVLADRRYYTEVSSMTKDKEAKKYITQNWQNANFITKALAQRADTMLKTAAAIVKYQEDFFKYGIKYLKPLTLAQIAEEIGMHESTVSRVTSNKYMQTPRGSFEMKYFFISGVGGVAGDVASTSVKETIKEIIKAEDIEKPFSDDFIGKELKKRGTQISRRTVMKYREAMEIPSSYDRKKLFRLH